jgi:hypothetical protein
MTDAARRNLLQRLIHGQLAGADASKQLAPLDWDVDEPVVTLSATDATHLLSEFLAGKRRADEIVDWAEALEVREDVEIDAPVRDLLFVLANPEINGPLTPEIAREWVDKLQRGPS